jgi:hypothetical protein
MTINAMVAGGAAVENKGDAISDRVNDIRNVAAHAVRTASRVTYTTAYMLSYGVVFATVFVARSLPLENPVGHGIVDGGRAARDALGRQH